MNSNLDETWNRERRPSIGQLERREIQFRFIIFQEARKQLSRRPTLTQISSWVILKFPIAQEKWSGVRKSRGDTVQLTCSLLVCARSRTIVFMSLLQRWNLKIKNLLLANHSSRNLNRWRDYPQEIGNNFMSRQVFLTQSFKCQEHLAVCDWVIYLEVT